MKEKETGKMKNQNNTAQSAEKQSFLQKKNVEISFKRYAIDAMGAMALGLFASLLIGTIIKTLAENVGTTGLMAALAAITDTGELAAKVAGLSMLNRFCWILWQIGNYATMVTGVAMAAAIGYALDAPPLVLFMCGRSGNEYFRRLRWAAGCIICSDYCLRGRKTCI